MVLNSVKLFKTMAKLHWLTDHQAETILLMRLQLQSREDKKILNLTLCFSNSPPFFTLHRAKPACPLWQKKTMLNQRAPRDPIWGAVIQTVKPQWLIVLHCQFEVKSEIWSWEKQLAWVYKPCRWQRCRQQTLSWHQ